MDISRENEYLLYLAVQSVRGGRVMTLPEGQDYASLFSRAGQAGVFRAVAGGIAPQLLPDEGRSGVWFCSTSWDGERVLTTVYLSRGLLSSTYTNTPKLVPKHCSLPIITS